MSRRPHWTPSADESQAYADAYGPPSSSVVQCHECGAILDSAVIAEPHRPDCSTRTQLTEQELADVEAMDDRMEQEYGE